MPKKHGFTLVEVLIALTLMIVVLAIIGMAIDTHLRMINASRMEVEEAQLARAVLEKVSRDIRSVVVSRPIEDLTVDTSVVGSMFDGMMGGGADLAGMIGGDSADALAGTLGSAGLGSSGDTSDSSGTSSGTAVPEEDTVVGTMPGIYGSTEWIQVDTGRLPRGETFKTDWILAEGTSLGDRVSPTKTVIYYLGEDTGQLSREESSEERVSGSLGVSLERIAPKYGLYRRQLDRYVVKYAQDNDYEYEYQKLDEALAPEIESILFEFYDSENEEWLDYWDMDEMQALPSAVRVTVYIRKAYVPRSFVSNMFGSSQAPIEMVSYSTVIPMPLSYQAPAPAEEETTDPSAQGAAMP
ncbi:MAG: prepilin-type N-terminal cleavage/methylation domain-containing protein [Thermoguttaceae bacterium]